MLRGVHFLALLLCALLPAGSAAGATNLVTGTVATNTTLSGTNLLQGTVVVTNGVVLTIEPGTRMLMNTNATLLVYGQLLANGASNQPITFTRSTTAARWKQILLDRAQPSRLSHCVFEYANSAGDHKDYYFTNCNPPLYGPRTNYHEAVVALASHLDLEGCVFQNLPGAGGEGDAIAIISDHPDPLDTNSWNSASATVRRCRFLDIGQGVHTRYAYVLVEACYFTSHNGDNDDIDLYGESMPPPLVLNNVFLNPSADDMINPTRCSAIIMGNLIMGGPDHCVVLRDVCKPIMMNNVIYSCGNGGISVQNGCDALLVNNTLVNCNNAIKLFDHQARVNDNEYCLAAASGRATLLNNVIWNSNPAFDLSGFAWGNLYVNVAYSDIQGGTNNSVRQANSTLISGPGNLDANPLFAGVAATNFHILAGSPCIDAGTNVLDIMTASWSARVTNDFDGIPRPLDGNGDGSASFDIGAFEYLLPTADSNGDGIPDGWTWQYRLNPTDPGVAAGNPDNDPHTTLQEWVADTNPTNALSYFRIAGISNGPPVAVHFLSSSNRQYTLSCATNLAGNGPDIIWSNVSGQVNVPGTGATRALTDTNAPNRQKFYRVGVRVP